MRSLFSLLLVFSAILAFSQEKQCILYLTGLVEDGQGNALPGATVQVQQRNLVVSTGLDGAFELSNLCPGEYVLLITYIGYEDQQLTVRMPQQKPVIIKLRTGARLLHDVIIEGNHEQQHGFSQAFGIISEKELLRSSGKSLGEVISSVPGVATVSSGPGIQKPVIHGLHGQRILILNNSIRQEGQQWGLEHAPEVDPYIASEIEVVKGAEAVRYGADALGGVVIINPAPLHYSSSWGGELNLGTMSNNRMGVFSGMFEGGLKVIPSVAWRIQGTIKKGGDYQAPDYTLSNTGTEELNFSGALGMRKDKYEAELFISSFNTTLGILRSAHTGNLDDLQQSIVNERPWYIQDFSWQINNPKQVVNHHLWKARFRKETSSGYLQLVYGGQYNNREEYDIRRGGRSNKPSLSLGLLTHVVDVTFDHSAGGFSTSVGINGAYKSNDVRNTGVIPLIPTYDQLSAGIFVVQKYKRDGWLLEGGFRYDHQSTAVKIFDQQDQLQKPTFNFHYFAGSFGATRKMNPYASVTTNIGYSARPPHVVELYSQGLHHGSAAIEYGLLYGNGIYSGQTNEVEKETSLKWVTSFHYTRSRFELDLTAHYNDINNYIYLRPYDTRLTTRGYFPVFQYEQTRALFAGVDIAATVAISSRVRYGMKASYLYAKDQTRNDRLLLIPAAQWNNSLTYTWEEFKKWRDIYVSVNVPVVFKQHRAPRTIYPADVAQDAIAGPVFDFMPPPDGYALLDFETGASLPLENRDLAIVFAVENILNTSYRSYLNRLRYFADEPGRNFTIRFKYTFHSHH